VIRRPPFHVWLKNPRRRRVIPSSQRLVATACSVRPSASAMSFRDAPSSYIACILAISSFVQIGARFIDITTPCISARRMGTLMMRPLRVGAAQAKPPPCTPSRTPPQPAGRFVSVVLGRSDKTAVARLVVSVVINPVYLQPLLVSVSKRPLSKGIEVSAPFVANLNATTTVAVVVVNPGPFTTVYHVPPYVVEVSPRKSVLSPGRSGPFLLVATAAFLPSMSQLGPSNNRFAATVTAT